jgi:hypothetical protein
MVQSGVNGWRCDYWRPTMGKESRIWTEPNWKTRTEAAMDTPLLWHIPVSQFGSSPLA